MSAFTSISIHALEELGGPRVILAAIPGGSKTLASEAGVSQSRVSQVLRNENLPWEWAQLIARLVPCSEWEVYAQLGQDVSDAVTSQGEPQRERS